MKGKMIKRVDEVERYYMPIDKCENIVVNLFWFAAVISLLIPALDIAQQSLIVGYVKILFVIIVLIHLAFTQACNYYFFPRAEKLRRKQNISNALGVSLVPHKTQLYYNNRADHSIERLGANVLESAFFTKKITKMMAKRRRLVVCSYLVAWGAIVYLGAFELDYVLAITQIVFSGEIIVAWLKLEVLQSRAKSVYEELYDRMLIRSNFTEKERVAGIVDSFVDYESLKSSMSVRLSDRLFKKHNGKLSKEWDRVCLQLELCNN